MDAEGYLFLAGRKIGVINLAGRKVFPEEIEAVLNRHPPSANPAPMAACIRIWGEVVEADLVLHQPHPSEADLQSVRETLPRQPRVF